MKVRLKAKPEVTGSSDSFNVHALAEILVNFDNDQGASSEYIKDYEVLLSDGNWHDMGVAFEQHFLITDNFNTGFFEPKNEEDQIRGFTL